MSATQTRHPLRSKTPALMTSPTGGLSLWDAYVRSGLTLDQLWLNYIGVGGTTPPTCASASLCTVATSSKIMNTISSRRRSTSSTSTAVATTLRPTAHPAQAWTDTNGRSDSTPFQPGDD